MVGLMLDPDEAVLFLVFVLPLIFLVEELWPMIVELPFYTSIFRADLESEGGGSGLCGVWQRLLGVLGVSPRAHSDLEQALSAVVASRRWGEARLSAQLVLRQRDREQNAKALLTAVHTLRTVATDERGEHQQELEALEAAALGASAEMQRERDERLESHRTKSAAVLERALASERRHAAEALEGQALQHEQTLAAAEAAHVRLSAAEFRQLEMESLRLRAAAEAKASTLQAQLDRALRGQGIPSSQAQVDLQVKYDEARARADRLAAELDALKQRATETGSTSHQPPPSSSSQQQPSSQQTATPPPPSQPPPSQPAPSQPAPSQPTTSSTGSSWSDLGVALASQAKRAVPDGSSRVAQRTVSGSSVITLLDHWQQCQQWKRIDASEGFVGAGSKAAGAWTSVLGVELGRLERSIEEEVCAWDYREYHYCNSARAVEEDVRVGADGSGHAASVASVAGGPLAGVPLRRDAGHGGWSLSDFCKAPQAVAASLTSAEVLALRLATGRLGGVLQSALLTKGQSAGLRPWATTLACLVSAIVKLTRAQQQQQQQQQQQPRGGGGDSLYLALSEAGGKIFEGGGLFGGGGSGGALSRGLLALTTDVWVAREAVGEGGKRCIVRLAGASAASAADVSWVSQFPQQCERLVPPGSLLTPAPSGGGVPAQHGVRCVDATLGAYTQPQPYSSIFLPSPPTDELTSGLSVPGCSAALKWACSTFDYQRVELAAVTELALPEGDELSSEGARMLGLLCGRAAREACPALEELSLRNCRLTPAALQKLTEGLSGGHELTGGGDEGLTLDLHGALSEALRARPADAPAVGEAIATLIQHAPHVAELDVGGCALGGPGFVPIARALAESTTLSHLGASAVGLGGSADAAKRLAAALRQNGDLLSLDVRYNGLSTEGMRSLRAAAGSRPRSAGGVREPLDLRTDPQAPLPRGATVPRTPRSDEFDDDDDFDDDYAA